MQALPPDNQRLKPVNASRLSVFICEGPKGIDGKLDGLLPASHTMILWAASLCRVTKVDVFTTKHAGNCCGETTAHLPIYIGHVQGAFMLYRASLPSTKPPQQ